MLPIPRRNHLIRTKTKIEIVEFKTHRPRHNSQKTEPMTSEGLRDVLLPWAAPLRGHKTGDWLSENFEEGQSLTEFRAAWKPRDIDRSQRIQIFRYDNSDQRLKPLSDPAIPPLSEILRAYFPRVEFVFTALSDQQQCALVSSGIKKENGPHLGCGFLVNLASKVRKLSPEPPFAVTLLTETDLHDETDSSADGWVFGYSEPNKGGICVSWERCKRDGEDFSRSRCFVSLLLHEICHVFYIKHCVVFDCLMNGVNGEEELAAQSLHLCPECHAKLFDILRFDPIDRFDSLRKIFHGMAWKRDASLAANLLARLKEADTR